MVRAFISRIRMIADFIRHALRRIEYRHRGSIEPFAGGSTGLAIRCRHCFFCIVCALEWRRCIRYACILSGSQYDANIPRRQI
jgi:hypothetical protein